MAYGKRIFLFLLTNIAIIGTISIALAVFQSVTGIQLHDGSLTGLFIFCLFWGMGGAFISLLLSKWLAKKSMNVQIISEDSRSPQEQEILQMVHTIAKRAGLPKMPEVGIYESPEVNAFATGPSKSNSLVALSTGLLNRMNRDEVEGVIGHEVAHIANGDMVTMTLVQGVVNAFVMFFARIIARIVSSQVDEKISGMVYFATTIVLDILFSFLGSLVVAFFSRAREYRADKGGAQYAGREKMIAGLRRLQSMYDQLEPDNTSMATLKISSRPAGLMALFSTHPPLADRIQKLEHFR